jgi:hypothetical protein
MKRSAALSAGLMFWAGASFAQAPTESVTVTGQKAPPEEVIKSFVQSYAASAPALGRMAKWVRPVCPITDGLSPALNALVTKRVREVAALAGAPLMDEANCQPNIDIVFTQRPQALLDQVRKEHPVLLGYHFEAQSGEIATMRYPIQAWYTTETEDEHGLRQVDNPQDRHGSDDLASARTMKVTASRIGDRLRSQFFHAMIVIDIDKINGLQIGALADDIAMMTLAQPQAFDACLTPPSIINLMTPGCAGKPKSITDMDIAYLRAVYRLDTAKVFSSQKSEIAYRMRKSLGE